MSNVVDTLARLVASPTVSSQPLTEMAAYVADRCETAGFTVERFVSPGEGKLNLVCSRGPRGTDGLVLSGHMDVVPVEGQPWTTDPFRLTAKGSRLVGRGSADMKGFIAATLHAIEALPPLQRELVLVWTCDEEVGCLGSRGLVQDLAGRPIPTACLIGEPTSFRILRMHPGHTAVRVVTTGRAAHSSKPDLGENAICKASRVVERLDQLADDWRRDVRFADMLERPFVVMNVASIHGGTAVNIVPDRCTLEVGFRALPGMEEEALIAEMRARLAGLATVEAMRSTPAMLTPSGTALEGLLREHATAESVGAAAFATDGGNLCKLGMEPLVFGPGSIDVAHKADEWVDEGELQRTIPVLQELIARRCG